MKAGEGNLRAPDIPLAGLDILVVEDETIISFLIEDMLAELGCSNVRYASGVREALALIDERLPDTAMLDANLSGESVYPVARRLDEAGVPFIFATGYGPAGLPAGWPVRPLVQKPFQPEAIAAALLSVLEQVPRRKS